jgi:hypothetical protein
VKTTVDIPDDELEEAMRHAQATTKREAIVKAIIEFNRRHRREKLASALGSFDGFPSSGEIVAGRTSKVSG